MATYYSVHIEFDRHDIPAATVERLVDELAEWHAAIGHSPRGWVDIQMSVPAETPEGASSVAVALTAPKVKARPIRIESMTEAEFDARQGFTPMPELIGATDAAELIGVSRQRILQLVDEHKLQATKVGKSLVFSRDAVEAYSTVSRTS
jgi:excisionase family DNA binding protein